MLSRRHNLLRLRLSYFSPPPFLVDFVLDFQDIFFRVWLIFRADGFTCPWKFFSHSGSGYGGCSGMVVVFSVSCASDNLIFQGGLLGFGMHNNFIAFWSILRGTGSCCGTLKMSMSFRMHARVNVNGTDKKTIIYLARTASQYPNNTEDINLPSMEKSRAPEKNQFAPSCCSAGTKQNFQAKSSLQTV